MKSVFLSICGATVAMGTTVEFGGRIMEFANPDCYLPLDVLFLQDSTGSFVDDLPNVVKQIPRMISAIVEANPDSWFGVANFKDKPFSGFGTVDDYCFSLNQALSPNVEDTLNAYKKIYATGGADLPEAQAEAIIDSFQYNKVGWRPIGKEPGMAGARLIIISTDAQAHFEGENHQADFPSYANHTFDPSVKKDDPNFRCDNMRYPNVDQMAAVVKQEDLQYIGILTPKNDSDVIGQWTWINEDILKQPSTFYQFIASDSHDFIEGVLKTTVAVTKEACALTTTPAPMTTTTTPTTATPTTTTPTTTTTTTTALTTTPVKTSSKASKTTDTATSPPCPCPCPQPCPPPCHCGKCCKDGVMLKVGGHPVKIDMNIEYENKKL